VVAEVDNVPVTLRDVKSEILASRGYSPALEELAAGRAEVSGAIRILIERSIVLREGDRRGIVVSFPSLEEEVARHRADFPPGGLEKALLQMGMSEDEWRERLKNSILYRKSAEAIARGLVPGTPGETEQPHRDRGKETPRPERVRVRQFLFGSAAQAGEARDRLLKAGGPAGDGIAADGVDLGFFTKEQLPPELPPELFRMKEGEVTGPVSLEGSVSLFRVDRREPAGGPAQEGEEQRIREALLSGKREAAYRQWLAQALGNASVKVHPELLEKLFERKK
jgi:hypothetical protein